MYYAACKADPEYVEFTADVFRIYSEYIFNQYERRLEGVEDAILQTSR